MKLTMSPFWTRPAVMIGVVVAGLTIGSCAAPELSNSPAPTRKSGIDNKKKPATSPNKPATDDTTSTDDTVPSTSTNSSNPINPLVVNQNVECYKADVFICKIERLITDKTNRYRASRGLKGLTHDPKLSFVARDWSAKQAQSGDIGHDGFPNARVSVYQREFGVSRSMYAENVAYTGGGSSTRTDVEAEAIAEEFAVMWWNSSDHRANMVGNYRNLGVGISAGNSSWYATQIFD